MRITSKGQITIPAKIRQQAGLLPGAEISFAVQGDKVTIIPVMTTQRLGRGEQIVAHLRRHKGDIKISTDEVIAMTRGK